MLNAFASTGSTVSKVYMAAEGYISLRNIRNNDVVRLRPKKHSRIFIITWNHKNTYSGLELETQIRIVHYSRGTIADPMPSSIVLWGGPEGIDFPRRTYSGWLYRR